MPETQRGCERRTVRSFVHNQSDSEGMTDSQLPQLVRSSLTSPSPVDAPVVARRVKPKTSREGARKSCRSCRVRWWRAIFDEGALSSLEAVVTSWLVLAVGFIPHSSGS